MRIAICEDEVTNRDGLAECIQNWMHMREVSVEIETFESAEAFLCTWPDTDFDLVFLDIQMKHMTGLQLAESVRKTGSELMLVFVTGFRQYVLKGYDVDALHYLIKPVTEQKLMPVLDKAYRIWSSGKTDTMVVFEGNERRQIHPASIYYIAMISHTAEIHTSDGIYKLRKTAAGLTKELPAQFVRCHRSYIVNLHRVECVHKNTLTLKDGTKLPVSRNFWKDLNIAFIKFHME